MLVLPLMGIVLISGLFGGVCGIFACGGIGIMAAVMDGMCHKIHAAATAKAFILS